MPTLTVEKLYKNAGNRLGLKLVAGRTGLGRIVTSSHIQKPGLALTGLSPIDVQRVQILGEKEMVYLSSLSDAELELRLQRLLTPEVPCIIITRNLDISPLMLQMADAQQVPLFRTSFDSGELIQNLSKYFEEAFTRFGTIHGVLVEVFGLGVLIIGASGVGKSECALDLISRGHRLVADDVVDVTLGPDNVIMGSGSHLIRHHMEVRGLGIINIRELFGISSVRERCQLDLVVELVDWDQRKEYDRLGLDEKHHHILERPVSLLQIPVSPGRNLTTIIEVAARNHLLKQQGIHSVEELHKRLSWAISAEQSLGAGSMVDEDDG
jgi:HPr kinase/phosphorylase